MDSKKNITLGISLLITVVFIGFGFNSFKSNEKGEQIDANLIPTLITKKKTTPTQLANSNLKRTKGINSFVQTLEERLQFLSNTRDLSPYDEESISSAINDPRVWDFSTQVSLDDLPLDELEKQDGRSFFNANPARVAISIPGDVLEVALPDLGEPLLLDVKQAGVLENGSVTLKGSIQGEDGTFNMTQNNSIVAGHINTSTNTYSFEVFNETGWIHESGALFTGELPPVVDDNNTVVNSTLGNQGEHIIAKGNNQAEDAVHNHSHDDNSYNASTPINSPIEE